MFENIKFFHTWTWIFSNIHQLCCNISIIFIRLAYTLAIWALKKEYIHKWNTWPFDITTTTVKKRYKQFAEESQLQEIHWIKINNENKAWKFNLESQLLDLSYNVK